MLVSAKLQPPSLPLFISSRWKRYTPGCKIVAKVSQFVAFYLAPIWIKPDFVIEISRYFHLTNDRQRLIVRVLRFELYFDFVVRTIKIMLGPGVDIIPVPRDSHCVTANDFTTRCVGDTCLDKVFPIL